MDLSLIYFIFPRLSESRRALSGTVRLADRPLRLPIKGAMPARRDRQYIRLVAQDEQTWRRFFDKEEMFGVTGHLACGNSILLPLESKGMGYFNFSCKPDWKLKKIDLCTAEPGLFKVYWVDHTHVK